MKILDFFLSLWVIFALLDPDPKSCRESTKVEKKEISCFEVLDVLL